jgi:hypothetical protein
MNIPKTLRAAAPLVALLLLTSLAALALAGCGGAGNPADIVNNAQDQANNVARQANLQTINTAIQVYVAEHEGTKPTDISQLVSYLGGKIPSDPMGGTYYVYLDGSEAKAGVK